MQLRTLIRWVFIAFIFCYVGHHSCFGSLISSPIDIQIKTEKNQYYEGERISIEVVFTNTDALAHHAILLPHTQNSGPKLLRLRVEDVAKNTSIMRYQESAAMNMLADDKGSTAIYNLKPLERKSIVIYLNDEDYDTKTASHHGFGVPLFAGAYQLSLLYRPFGIALGESIFDDPSVGSKAEASVHKTVISEQGLISPKIDLNIVRSADTLVRIDRQDFYVKTDGHRYFYFSEYVDQITTDLRCIHITSMPPNVLAIGDEYFYTHFTDLYAEFFSRFADGDMREYRKYSDYCPDYLYTERYNEGKQLIEFAQQLPTSLFYKVTYNQPQNSKKWEVYCNQKGTLCNETTYFYSEDGAMLKTESIIRQPCAEVYIGGKKRSVKIGYNLESK